MRRRFAFDIQRDELGCVLLPEGIKSESPLLEIVEINGILYVLAEPGKAVEWTYFCPNCYKDRRYPSPDCDMAYVGYNYTTDFMYDDPEGLTCPPE